MTLTIEVEREGRLREEARRRGVPAEALAGAMLDEALQDLELDAADVEEARRRVAEESEAAIPFAQFEAEAEAQRAAHCARVRALQGKYAHVPGTVDDFMRERSEEAKREMQKETA
jgi:hypothetical protein